MRNVTILLPEKSNQTGVKGLVEMMTGTGESVETRIEIAVTEAVEANVDIRDTGVKGGVELGVELEAGEGVEIGTKRGDKEMNSTSSSSWQLFETRRLTFLQ